jgi:Flp pilus assembly protein TadG
MIRNLRRPPRVRAKGMVAIVVALSSIVLIGFVALATDVGYVVYSQRRLQAATDAAALAGAADLWTKSWTTAQGSAMAYTAGQGGTTGNVLPGGVVALPADIEGKQLSTASSPLPYAKAVSTYNGIQVTQQANVPLFFARAFGVQTVPISATSKAAAGGGSQPAPYNVMIILDTTASMNTKDSNCVINGSTQTRLACAQAGARELLQGLTNAGDYVGVMAFPPLQSAETFACNATAPNRAANYTAPGLSYQIAPLKPGFLSASNSSTSSTISLNTNSSAVAALGGASCSGLSAPGGLGTYYADALAAAQAALVNISTGQNPQGQNAIILLSDGDASSTSTQLGSGNVLVPTSTNGTQKGTSIVGSECATAVAEAGIIQKTSTQIYTIAYIGGGSGSTGTQPCSDATGNPGGLDYKTPYTPCSTMQAISSGKGFFYSDTCSTAGGTASLSTIFQQITYSLTKPRLIPLGAT